MNYKIEYNLKYDTHSSTKVMIVKNCISKEHAESKFFKHIIKKRKNAIAEILKINEHEGEDQLFTNLKNIFEMK